MFALILSSLETSSDLSQQISRFVISGDGSDFVFHLEAKRVGGKSLLYQEQIVGHTIDRVPIVLATLRESIRSSHSRPPIDVTPESGVHEDALFGDSQYAASLA